MEPFNDASRFAWACSVFGLQPRALPQEVRAAIFSHLDDANFVPPAAWRQAISLLSDPRAAGLAGGGDDAFHETLENSLAEEVDQFATRFFTLPRGLRPRTGPNCCSRRRGFPACGHGWPHAAGPRCGDRDRRRPESARLDPGRSDPQAFRAQPGSQEPSADNGWRR